LAYGRRVDASLPARSLGQCLGDIWRREGPRGLWKGSVPSVVKAAPAAAVTFVAYEAAAAWLLAERGRAAEVERKAAP
jgi:solute carrier family 25 thiamine pyrophosphate transporter 19